MLSLKIVCLFVITLVYSKASPVPQRSTSDFESNNQLFGSDDLFNIPQRTGRQYYYDDLYSFPYEYYNAPSYSSYYDPYYNPAPVPAPAPYAPYPSPVAYPPRRKGNRREGLPFQSTTQKYTIWDLA